MAITQSDIDKLVMDPTGIQRLIINEIETVNNIEINDPTSPFIYLMELTAMLARANKENNLSTKRDIFPSLAKNSESLYNHIQGDDLMDMVAVASKGSFTMFVNATDFINNGYQSDTEPNIVKMVIPKYTKITVVDTMYMTMNDISLRFNTTTNAFMIENIINDYTLAINDLGVLRSSFMDDVSGVPWILFEYYARQVSLNSFEDTINTSTRYINNIDLNGEQYYYSEVFMKSSTTGNVYEKINTSFSGFVYDPAKPTIHIAIKDSVVTYTIPDAYITNGIIRGKILINLFTTKGAIYIESSNYGYDKFSISLGDTTTSLEKSVTPNITLLTKSNFNLEGGVDQRSFSELKQLVIDNAIGKIDQPITNFELTRFYNDNGFKIEKILDSITERRYLATKNLPISKDVVDRPIMDLHIAKIKLITGNYTSNKYFYKYFNAAVIKPGAIFVNENNNVRMLDTSEVSLLESMSTSELIEELKSTKFFFSPFCYVTNIINDIATVTSYDLASPEINNVKIISKYSGDISVNIDMYGVEYTNQGYNVHLTVITSGNFASIMPYVKIQLSIPIKNTNKFAYFYADYNTAEEKFIIPINTNLYINNNDGLEISNGVSSLATKILSLESKCYATIFTTDTSTSIGTYSVTHGIYDTSYVNPKPMTEESFTLHFGDKMDYLFTNVRTEYTERMYKQWPNDVELRYEEDVYETDQTLGTTVTPIYSNGICIGVDYNKIHNAGDIIYDTNGDVVYKHLEGDVVVDENNIPIIDTQLGIIRIIDINLLEYEFYKATDVKIIDYFDNSMTNLRSFILDTMPASNDKLIDNTLVTYGFNTTVGPIDVTVGKNTYKANGTVTPSITVYVKQEARGNISDFDLFEIQIGKIIHEHIKSGYVDSVMIKDSIVESIGDDILYSVVLSGLDGSDIDTNKVVLDKYQALNNSKTFGINKKLYVNINNDISVKYDIDFTIEYI